MVLRVVFPRTPKPIRADNVLIITRSAHTPFPRAEPGELVAILPAVTVEPSPVVAEAVEEAALETLETFEPVIWAPVEVSVPEEAPEEAPADPAVAEEVHEDPIAPEAEVPAVDVPEVPVAETPEAEAPVVEAPVVEAPVVEVEAPAVEAAPEAEGSHWDASMKKADLLAAAEAKGLDLPATATKAEIIAALKAAEVVA